MLSRLRTPRRCSLRISAGGFSGLRTLVSSVGGPCRSDKSPQTQSQQASVFGHEPSEIAYVTKLDLGGTGADDCDMLMMAAFRSLEELNLANCREISDFEALPTFPRLRKLDVSETSVGDSALPTFARLPMLEDLNLCGCEKIVDVRALLDCRTIKSLNLQETSVNDDSIEVASKLPALERVRFGACDSITDFSRLDKCQGLQSINASSTVFNDSALEAISHLLRLKELAVPCCFGLTDLSPIAKLKSLETLNLRGNQFDDRTFASAVAQLTSLSDLDVSECECLQDLSFISTLKSLKSLTLGNLRLSPQGAASLCSSVGCLAGLEEFNARECSMFIRDLLPLSKCKALKRADLSFTNAGDALLTPLLNGSCALEALEISHCTGLGALKCIKGSGGASLAALDLTSTDINDEALRSLSTLPQLADLILWDCKDLQSLGSLSDGFLSLSKLDVSRTRLVNELPMLAALPRLSELHASEVPVKDLRSLSCSKLKKLSLDSIDYNDGSTLAEFGSLPNLEELSLSKIPQKLDFSSITAYANLCKLTLCAMKVDNAVIRQLSKLPRLQHLRILSNQADITDLAPLAHCRSLKSVSCWGSKVDKKQLKYLRRSLPLLSITA